MLSNDVRAVRRAALALVLSLAALVTTPAEAFGPPRPISGDFLLPSGVAVDGPRVIVADTLHFQMKTAEIASLTGMPVFTSFGMVATPDPVGERLGRPVGVASDGAGNVFVVDQAGSEVQRFEWDGAAYVHRPDFLVAPGNTAGSVAMRMPSDIAIDSMGNLYVLDGANRRVLTAAAPSYASWTVYASDPTWPSCSGLDVTPLGDRVYLACASDDPLLEVPAVGAWAPLGRAGRRDGELYEPQDVAVDPSGALIVADTGNARIELFDPLTGAQTHVAGSSDLSQPTRLALSGGDLFATDVARNQLVAFLSTAGSAADVYVRDYAGDEGDEPSSSSFTLTSPDIIIRQHDDVDLAVAERDGLHVAYGSQEPRTNLNNYVYVAVQNRGTTDALGAVVQLFSADVGSALDFPDDWRRSDFYRTWDTPMLNEPNHTIPIDRVPAATTSGGVTIPGYRVVGPLVWRPRAPDDAMSWDGSTQVIARLNLAGDTTIDGSGDDAIRNSNNVARREVIVRRSPATVGTQNTLVVLARFSGSGDAADEMRVRQRLTELDAWIGEVSRGATRIEHLIVGPYELAQAAPYYTAFGQDPLVELTEEVVARAYEDDPGVLDGLIATDPADDITRIVVVVNDPMFPADRATTGSWSYEIDGATRWLSTSVHTVESALAEWAHGYAHQLGLQDLQLYPGITLDPDDRLPVGWDVMARPASGELQLVHPLGSSKAMAPWLAPAAGIQFVPRPTGSYDSGVLHLAFQSVLNPGETGLLALGLSEGATDFFDERHFIMIEARDQGLGDSDGMLRGSGVLAYRFDLDIEQGSAPVLLSDHTPSTTTVEDAAIPEGGMHTLTGYGVDVEVLGRHDSDPRAGYDVRVQYAPPGITDVGFEYDGNPWETEEIWIDSPDDGFEDPATAVPGEERAHASVDNFVYVKVHNYGDFPAYDVEARFSFSDPFHTVGGESQFVPYDAVLIPMIPPRSSVNARILWRPAGVDDPHRCVRVVLRRLLNDENRGNDDTQKNLQIAVSTMMTSGSTPSGFAPAKMMTQWMNTASTPKRIYYRVDGLPSGWRAHLSKKSAHVSPGATVQNQLEVEAPPSAPICSRTRARLSAWSPQEDTIERLGGATLEVSLRNDVVWQGWQPWVEPCSKKEQSQGPCQVIAVWMATSRPAVQKVYARFTGPTGYSHFRTMYTDANGVLLARFAAHNGGTWTARFEAPGDDCHAPAVFETYLQLSLQISKDQDKDGLPDDQELSGDADGDGIDNVLDPDSDGDKKSDGYEKTDDADQDGTPNVIDKDS